MATYKLDDIRRFSFGIKVRGAYVQQPERARLIGIEKNICLFSVDATALYPSITALSNVSESTLQARIYDYVIVHKTIEVIKNMKENGVLPEQAKNIVEGALFQQFQAFVKKEKPQKQKETLDLNVKYYTNLFVKIIKSRLSWQDIFEPKTDEGYYLLKSCLHPLLEAITWTSPYNLGYNNTFVDYVFHPEKFEAEYKNRTFYILDNIYSTKTVLKELTHDEAIEYYFKKYILNPHGVMYIRHKDYTAPDILKLKEALDRRKVIKNTMIVLKQLQENIKNGNDQARVALKILMEDPSLLTPELQEAAQISKIIKDKKIKDLNDLKIDRVGDDDESLKMAIFSRNLLQTTLKVFANSSYGILGLSSYPYSSPLLGNSITTAGKIYGIKTCQVAVGQVIEREGNVPKKVS